ncbi:hypothetical protein EBR96_01420 [bacterium]|nr:hypothetical protein [bacterium]
MIIQVHDELVFDGIGSESETVMKIVKSEMESADHFRVPLEADIASGPNWKAVSE